MSANGEGTPDISEMVKGIMQNPEFAGLVRELRGEQGKDSHCFFEAGLGG